MDLSVFGITQADIQHVQAAPSLDEAAVRLDLLKGRARKELRKLAIDLHPDRNGNDLVKTERLKTLTELLSKFTAVQVKLAPAPPVMRVYVVQHGMYGSYAGTASAATTTAGYTWVRLVTKAREFVDDFFRAQALGDIRLRDQPLVLRKLGLHLLQRSLLLREAFFNGLPLRPERRYTAVRLRDEQPGVRARKSRLAALQGPYAARTNQQAEQRHKPQTALTQFCPCPLDPLHLSPHFEASLSSISSEGGSVVSAAGGKLGGRPLSPSISSSIPLRFAKPFNAAHVNSDDTPQNIQ